MTDTRTHDDQTTTATAESSRVRNEIDDTREHLGATVEAIGDRVLPGRIIERRKETTARSLRGLRDRIMGTAHDTREQLADSAGSTVDHLRDAPDSLAEHTEGSPLAAGVVALRHRLPRRRSVETHPTRTPRRGEGGRRRARPHRRRRPAGPRESSGRSRVHRADDRDLALLDRKRGDDAGDRRAYRRLRERVAAGRQVRSGSSAAAASVAERFAWAVS